MFIYCSNIDPCGELCDGFTNVLNKDECPFCCSVSMNGALFVFKEFDKLVWPLVSSKPIIHANYSDMDPLCSFGDGFQLSWLKVLLGNVFFSNNTSSKLFNELRIKETSCQNFTRPQSHQRFSYFAVHADT